MNIGRLKFALLLAATALGAGCSKASLPQDDGAGDATVSPRPAPSIPGGELSTTTPGTTGPSMNTGAREPNPGRTPEQRADWTEIEQIEAQAKKLAHLEGCATSNDCRSAPVGSRGCGGPRYYLAWCAKSTDSVALYRKLEEVATAERNYNKKYQIASTCEMRMPPIVAASGGACSAQ